MNKKDFKRYMQQGLGRCIVTLRESENIEKYKDIVLWGCLHNIAYDPQCEGTRSAYVYELAWYFHDDEYFVIPIVDALLKMPNRNGWLFSHLCELLSMFAEDGNERAKNALYEKYDKLLPVLISKRRFGRVDFDKTNFEHLCISLSSSRDTDVLLKIAEDMGELFRKNPHYDGEDFSWFFSCAERTFGEKKLVSLLKRKAKQSENILCFYENYQKFRKRLDDIVNKPRNIEIPSAESISDEVNTIGKLSARSKVFFRKANAEEWAILAHLILNEDDLAKKAELLSEFSFRDIDFPFQHEKIIEYSKSENERLREVAFEVLANCQSEAVKQYAHELLTSGEHTYHAVKMLITNYIPEDKEILLSELYRIKADYNSEIDWHSLGAHILDAYDKNIKLPKEFLIYIYETTLCSFCRENVVRELAKHKWLTDDIIEECRFDSNYEISEYIERYYPSK